VRISRKANQPIRQPEYGDCMCRTDTMSPLYIGVVQSGE